MAGTSNSDYLIFLGTTANISGTIVITPTTSLTTPYLKTYPSAVYNYPGTHVGNGVYLFTKPDDGRYKVYESISGAEISSWGGANGKWIGDDVLDYYATSAQMASAQIEIDNLESATAALNTAISGKATLSANQTWSGINVFNNKTTLSGGNTTSTSNKFYGRNDFVTEAPYSALMPVSNGQLSNKYYVDSYVDNKVATIANGITGTYQQSINVIRLVPNGAQETSRLYTTWANAMVGACAKNPTIINQVTVEIEGMGNSSSAILMASHLPGTTTAFADYVHFKGYGSNVLITLGQDVNSFSASASVIGAVVFENLILQDPLGDSYLTNWKNVIFKNVKFISQYDYVYGTWGDQKFYDCELYDCEFIGGDTASWEFNNCKGNIYSEQIPIVQGASLINYQTPSQMSLSSLTVNNIANTMTVNGNMDIKSITVSGSVNINGIGSRTPTPIMAESWTQQYGGAGGSAIALAEPDKWITVTIDGTNYSLPLYAQE